MAQTCAVGLRYDDPIYTPLVASTPTSPTMSNSGSFNQSPRNSNSSEDLQIRKNRLADLQKKLNDLGSELAQLGEKIARVALEILKIKETKDKTARSEKEIGDSEGKETSEETLVVRGIRRFGKGKGG